MTINFNRFAHGALFCFDKIIVPTLTTQQKKIATLVTLAFGVLAVCYGLSRCYQSRVITKILPNGLIEKGLFVNAQLEGMGERKDSVSTWQGEFKKGVFVKGKRVFTNGETWQGSVEKGSFHGPGQITKDGVTRDVNFFYDNLV